MTHKLPSLSSLSGVVLAGGRSQRFGGKKTLAAWGGETVVEAAIDCGQGLFLETIVAVKSPDDLPLGFRPRVRVLHDEITEYHPLAGLRVALAACRTSHAFVWGGDMPFISAALVSKLASLCEGEKAVVPVWQGVPQPLCAIYATDCLDEIETMLREGRRAPRELLQRVRARELPESEVARIDPEGRSFADIDTQEDYHRLRQSTVPSRTDERTRAARVTVVTRDGAAGEKDDQIAVEEPLEIRVRTIDCDKSVAITMRTPGHDEELAVGFLVGEGRLVDPSSVADVETDGTRVTVVLAANASFSFEGLDRNFGVTSACGVCGKESLEDLDLHAGASLSRNTTRVLANTILDLVGRLRSAQTAFSATGGLHAAGLFSKDGHMRLVREDVGRHNAVDKVVGALFMSNGIPAADQILVVSGRASFELVQKTIVAGIPFLVAVGAPSSLAIDRAKEAGLTLIGFTREERFNVYAGAERLGQG